TVRIQNILGVAFALLIRIFSFFFLFKPSPFPLPFLSLFFLFNGLSSLNFAPNCLAQDSEHQPVEVWQQLENHAGMTFAVAYDRASGLLVTASDDRSVRVWKLGQLTVSPPRVLFGHSARVWCVRTWRGNRILSAGEDGACLAWCLEDGSVNNACRGRKGGIRAIAVNEDLGLAALGGGDGAIWLWEVEGKESTGRQDLLTLKKSCGFAGHPKVVAVASKNLVVVATDKGSLVRCDVKSQFCCDVLTEPSLASYVAMGTTRSECEGIQEAETLVALGGLHGQVLIFPLSHPELLQSLKPYTGKVHSLTWVCARPSDRAADVPGRSWYLFTSGPDGLLIYPPAAKLSSHSMCVKEKGRFSLPSCRHRWHTCVAFLPFYQPYSLPFAFICGDRCGNLCFFHFPPSGDVSNEWICREPHDYLEMSSRDDMPLTERPSKMRENITISEPTSLLHRYHGRNGVTWVGMRGYNRVWSTGRDGAWRETRLVGRDGDTLRPIRSRRPALHLDWLARIVPSDLDGTDDSNALLLGFRGDTFVAMRNCLGEGEINMVSCGGGHRSWDFLSSSATENLFVFIKAGDVILSYSKLPELRLLQTGLHTRHTTCVQVLQYDHGNVVLATGSDDTTLRLLLLHKDADGIWRKCVASVINEHLSGVRAVAVATDAGDTLQDNFKDGEALEGGCTNFNHFSEIGDPCKQIRHHQSGVACIEARVVAKGRVVIVSGGDDNALSMTTIVVEPGGQCVSLNSVQTPRADASQVTAVKVLGVVEGAENVVVATVTAEQRLSLWKLSFGGEEFPKQLISFYNHVGDTAALDWWEDGVGGYCIVMCGLGLELVHITLSDVQLQRTAF
uniref:tRNA (34-2'-O)-methyltransferase regulator WDR6 n=1 Tax=Eptatretus burgeri TaxID=7764 RepID=A0A8C4QDL9_EPTBU